MVKCWGCKMLWCLFFLIWIWVVRYLILVFRVWREEIIVLLLRIVICGWIYFGFFMFVLWLIGMFINSREGVSGIDMEYFLYEEKFWVCFLNRWIFGGYKINVVCCLLWRLLMFCNLWYIVIVIILWCL